MDQGEGGRGWRNEVAIGIMVSMLARPPSRIATTSTRRRIPERKERPRVRKRRERPDAALLGIGRSSGPSTTASPVNSCPRIRLLGLRINVDLPHKRFTDEIKAP